jgi:hypothetical protein
MTAQRSGKNRNPRSRVEQMWTFCGLQGEPHPSWRVPSAVAPVAKNSWYRKEMRMREINETKQKK